MQFLDIYAVYSEVLQILNGNKFTRLLSEDLTQQPFTEVCIMLRHKGLAPVLADLC